MGRKELCMIAGISPVNQKARLPDKRQLRQGCRLQVSRESTTQTGRKKELTRGR